MEIKYYRCRNCCNVYNKNLKVCPKCGGATFISEDLNEVEDVFNILDGE